MPLTPGTRVILQPWIAESCPPCDVEPVVYTEAVGKRYTVQTTNPREYDGVIYQVLQLQRINNTDPGPVIDWPESAVKLAFGGIASIYNDDTEQMSEKDS